MKSENTNSSNRLTLLLFKDNLSPRTFQISLGWLSRLASVLIAGGILTIAAVGVALYYRYEFKHGTPTWDNSEVQSLQAQVKDLQAKIAVQPATTSAPVAAVTVTATPAAVAAPESFAALFRAKPLTQAAPLKIQNLRTSWSGPPRGKILSIQFELQYTGAVNGNQNGRIIILSKGPETLFAYPNGVFQSADSDLIDIDHGEYFSVSRFRETKADFGPLQNPTALKDIEVLVFSENKELLLDEKLKISAIAAKPPVPGEKK